MIIIRLVRRLRGFVRFTAQGVHPERFLNLLARARIHVWDVKRREYTLTGCAAASDYPRMRPLAKKAGVRLRLLEKQGLPFKKKRLRGRHGLLWGFGVFVLFLFVMSRFIWSVQVQGNEQVPGEQILSALEEIGVRPGVRRAGIDEREAERLLMLSIKELGWVALNIDGSTIYVVVNEADPLPPIIDPRTPVNVVAAESGQLIELRVYDGQPVLRKGDAVMQGEVIVSGITLDVAGQTSLRHARADVIAQVSREIEIRVPLNQTTHEETGHTARRDYLRVLAFEAPLFLPRAIQRPYIIERTHTPLVLLGAELPLAHRREVYTLMREVPLRLTEDAAKDRALHELQTAERAQFSDARVITRALYGGLVGEEFVLRGQYVVHMNIALPKEIRMSP